MESTRPTDIAGMPLLGLRASLLDSSVAVSARDVLRIGSAEDNDLVLEGDPTVSRYHLELRRRGAKLDLVDRSRNGTQVGSCLVHGQRVSLKPGTTITVGKHRLVVDDGEFEVLPLGPLQFGRLFGHSEQMRRVFLDAERVAGTDASVLIGGESGTGKELLAEAIHQHSRRSGGPLVTVDCAALSPQLVSSELFGHERGAFTGADRQHQGAFERASGGTLFLDEIGELPDNCQGMLLGALERGEFLRVGGTKTVRADVRIIAATHRDLHSQVNEGAFRHDLFFRLAVVRLELPPLRERQVDLEPLVRRIAESLEGGSALIDALLAGPTREALFRHSWPGNVRELRNWVHATVALGRAGALYGARSEGGLTEDGLLELPYRVAKGQLLGRFEPAYLKRLLERTGGNVRAAARLGEMNRSYLIELLKKHGVGR